MAAWRIQPLHQSGIQKQGFKIEISETNLNMAAKEKPLGKEEDFVPVNVLRNITTVFTTLSCSWILYFCVISLIEFY